MSDSGPDAINASGEFYAYSALADLATAFTSGELKGRMTRRIVTMSDGVLVVNRSKGGSSVSWPFAANVPEDIQVTGFTAAGSTVVPSSTAPIKVYL